MRFDLKVPYAEKEAAKQLGARWDAAGKVWYVLNQPDLTPFARWNPVAHSPTPASTAPRTRTDTGKASSPSAGSLVIGPLYAPQARVCQCLPWAVCEACRANALPS